MSDFIAGGEKVGWRAKLGFPASGRTWPEAKSRRGLLLAGQNLFGKEGGTIEVVSYTDADVTEDGGVIVEQDEMDEREEVCPVNGGHDRRGQSAISATSPLFHPSFLLAPFHTARRKNSGIQSLIAMATMSLSPCEDWS